MFFIKWTYIALTITFYVVCYYSVATTAPSTESEPMLASYEPTGLLMFSVFSIAWGAFTAPGILAYMLVVGIYWADEPEP